MKDIRLLTLYKQHYLDDYVTELEADISCLGYYDGIDIDEVDEKENRLSRKLSDSPISSIWYATGKKIEEITGGHGNQYIGIFRDDNDEESQKRSCFFWKIARIFPYCSVGFLKLKKLHQHKYKEIKIYIENKYSKQMLNKTKICYVLPYYTFDNADMILLFRSNSMLELEKTHQEIEEMEEVGYLHSVLGLDGKYVNLCAQEEKILESWNGIDCHINEHVRSLEMQIATSGEPQVLWYLKEQMDKLRSENKYTIKNYENMEYAYISGHANINIKLEDTDVASLIAFMLPKGFATHQNPLYGKNGVYNIKSSVRMKYHEWNQIVPKKNTKELEVRDVPKNRWCLKVIKQCMIYVEKSMEAKDENLYSLFLAMVRTLNNLDQYEGFAISEDVFQMIAPSFEMFNEKLQRAMEQNCLNDVVLNEMVKKSMRHYLEYVNSVVYHTIHMDQRYLMVPGCSETSYSLPIKLQIFYLWFVDKISNLLNDNGRKYSCIMATVMESRPETQCIELIPDDTDKIICIRLAQRSLFFPRNLLVIAAHELAHYTGKNIRCRRIRMTQLMKSMIYILVEGIFPTSYMGNCCSNLEQEIFVKYRRRIKADLISVIGREMKQKSTHVFCDSEYHAKDIEEPLIKLCMDMLTDIGSGKYVQDAIYYIPEEILKELNLKKSDEYVAGLQYITDLQNTLEKNRKRLLMSDVVNKSVRCLISLYQEVFADLAAVAILGCTFCDYQEAFAVSEGANVTKNRGTREQRIREKVIGKTVFQLQDVENSGDKVKVVESLYKDEELYLNVYNYTWVLKHLLEYAEECYETLCKMKSEKYGEVQVVREKYNMFTSRQMSAEQIYNEMQKCIQEYKGIAENRKY